MHTMTYPSADFPLVDRGTSQEIDYPFRTASSWVVRLPATRKAVVIGKWGPPATDPDEALEHALRLFPEESA